MDETILDTISTFPKTREINVCDFDLYEKWRKAKLGYHPDHFIKKFCKN